MASTREIRRRIRSVKNIAKVTKAMETVAASKMRKAQQQVLATRPYAEKSWEVLTYLARLRSSTASEQPLLQERPEKKIGLLLITGDRGLAGAYNANILVFAIWCTVLTALYGCFLGFLMDFLMSRTGLDLKSRKILEH